MTNIVEGKGGEVVVDDDAVVLLDVTDGGVSIVETSEEDAPQKKDTVSSKEKESLPRVRLREGETGGTSKATVDEATRALQEAKEKAERDAAAAQATAAQERARREAAERVALQQQQLAESAAATAEQAQMSLLDKGIESAQGEIAAIETQLQAAYEAGEFKEVASLQTRLSRATATLDRLEAEKGRAADTPKRAETTEGRVVAPSADGAVEQYLAGFAPEAALWLRNHPECLPIQLGGTASANARMMAGHYAAVAANVVPNTPDYFRIVEEHTGHKTPTSAAAAVTPAAKETREASSENTRTQPRVQPAAPPSRDAPAQPGQRTQRTVMLTRDQRDIAKLSFPNLPEKEAYALYAKNLIELESEGKLGRTTH